MCAQGTIVRILAHNIVNVLPHAGPELPENSRSGSVRFDYAIQDAFESYGPGRKVVGIGSWRRRRGERLQYDWLAEPCGLVCKYPLVEQLELWVEVLVLIIGCGFVYAVCPPQLGTRVVHSDIQVARLVVAHKVHALACGPLRNAW